MNGGSCRSEISIPAAATHPRGGQPACRRTHHAGPQENGVL